MKTLTLRIQKDQAYPISPKLYGIFLEDINFACDGGLNANKVVNYSFDGLYYDKKAGRALSDPLRYWTLTGGVAESECAGQISEKTRFLSFYVKEEAVLSNLGYNGHAEYATKPAMSVEEGHSYEFSCLIRGNFRGTVTAWVEDEAGEALTDVFTFDIPNAWAEKKGLLEGLRSEYGKLMLRFTGHGYVDLDLVCLSDADWWGKGDPKWTGGRFRRDMVEALRELRPKFLRFPGGCIVEGRCPGNEYNWKHTVGRLEEREANFNLWSETMEDGGYCQSYQLGFYEYFCLCEDLGAEPLPTLSAGLFCQARTREKIALDDPKFEEETVANYLDLIEFANGVPGSSKWAELRVQMGHPAPFGLKMIGVGNENYGRAYRERFERIEKAVHKVHPEIRLVFCGGLRSWKLTLAGKWDYVKTLCPGGWLDEHVFRSPRWFIRNNRRYDRYERGTAKVYLGEYAANGELAGRRYAVEKANPFISALAEAAFLTGIERNADVVDMASYAPLFNMVGGVNWSHNLIVFSSRYLMKTANYMVQQLFGANYGENYVPVKANLPKGCFCSCTYNGRDYFLKIVNTTRADYGLALPGRKMEHRCITGAPGTRNFLTFKGVPAHPVDIREGVLNPPRDEFDGKRVKREEGLEEQCLALLRAHSVNLFIIPEKQGEKE